MNNQQWPGAVQTMMCVFFPHHSKKEKSNPVKYKMQFTLFMTKLLNSSMEKLFKPT